MIEERIAELVEGAVDRALARHSNVVPLTYSVEEAADAIGCGETTVRNLLADGVLGTVPHMGTRRLIPRQDVLALVSAGASATGGRTTALPAADGPAESVSPHAAMARPVPLRRGHPAGGGPTSDEPLGAA